MKKLILMTLLLLNVSSFASEIVCFNGDTNIGVYFSGVENLDQIPAKISIIAPWVSETPLEVNFTQLQVLKPSESQSEFSHIYISNSQDRFMIKMKKTFDEVGNDFFVGVVDLFDGEPVEIGCYVKKY